MIKIDRLTIQTQQKVLVDLSMTIYKTTALVGQSGSGKSLTLKALLGLLPSDLKVDLKIDTPFPLIRGETLSFIPQNPFTALSPRTKISKQFFASETKVQELFKFLDLDWRLFREYPPNLSGGQLQRVIIAMALSNNPKVLLLDEPTTALDSELKYETIQLLKKLQKKFDFYMLFVTHEIALASELCEYCVILKKGRVIEQGKSKEVLLNPKNSYTKELIESSFAFREFRQ
jgi:peptide/nickel transport system ATP-binding protein